MKTRENAKKKYFTLCANNPESWHEGSINIKMAADKLDAIPIDFNNPTYESVTLMPVQYCLYGMSFENLAKAIFIAENNVKSKGGKLNEEISTHEICTLISKTEFKLNDNEKGLLKRRDRQGETLFIDAREMGSMVNRTLKELTNDDIAKITQTYHIWRGEELTTASTERESANKEQEYEDIAGYCKSATLSDIKANDYVLTPGRYVGAADIIDDGIPFETKMSELSQTLYSQMSQADELDNAIRKNLQALGYGEERFGENRDSEERND